MPDNSKTQSNQNKNEQNQYHLKHEQQAKIDFCFIAQLDNKTLNVGYMPKDDCGVHIVGDLDLGQQSDRDLRKLGLNPTLIGKLYPYLGRKGADAAKYLVTFPLVLSSNETNAIALSLSGQPIRNLIERYNNACKQSFCDLPMHWQTVIFSTNLLYGDIETHYPLFWQALREQNWQKALLELDSLPSENAQRHALERQYISTHT